MQADMHQDWIDEISWPADGLIPAVAQDHATGRLLMVAWMNREALASTVDERRAVYFSRSRRRLWRKGERSGCEQLVREVRLDCDNDVILLSVEQKGGAACHTGRLSCFFQRLENDRWQVVEPVVRDVEELYGDPGPGT